MSVPSPRTDSPLVSVVLTTRDRPRFLPIALECYRRQTYVNRELIVVDDGAEFPADPDLVDAAGGRLVAMEPESMLGAKLNRGAAEAGGEFCQKMDDDDWYAPNFMETMIAALLKSWAIVCRPTSAFLAHFLFFDVARWEVRESVGNNVPGATILFSRDAWEESPFRAVGNNEDNWFLRDQLDMGGTLVPVRALKTFLAVRHGGGGGNRGHTWTEQATGQIVEEYLQNRPLFMGGPEGLLPGWALDFYRSIQRDLRAGDPTRQPAVGDDANTPTR
jgi:glycosyltransferase involved in cell wall biosynthesis